jgi:hypothetical protein
MINKPTLLILGAGASMPFGFPSGEALVNHICEMSNSDRPDVRAVISNDDDELFTEFKQALKNSGRLSIDSFLEHNPRYMSIGKLAIAAALIPCEIEQKLFEGNSWYKTLFKNMNATVDEFEKNQLTIITYNYDRSLEHFLITALHNSYESVTYQDAYQMVSKIPIVHLHGALGDIPASVGDVRGFVRHYRAEPNTANVRAAAQGVKIIHEDIGNDPEFAKANQMIDEAELICFLGFGYDETNLQRLNNRHKKGKPIYGTTPGLGRVRSNWLARYLPEPRGFLKPMMIDDFLDNYPILLDDVPLVPDPAAV